MRQDGYYWCKYKNEWIVAKYVAIDKTWISVEFGEDGYEYEDILEEIDERQIVRDKPKMSKEQITKAEELISDTIRKVDKLFGLL